ncbi:MAG: hypothetical protein KKB59_18865 [Spirochaetes bacterium]|nr:hypothetical protein [Spirochaetota bacterium]
MEKLIREYKLDDEDMDLGVFERGDSFEVKYRFREDDDWSSLGNGVVHKRAVFDTAADADLFVKEVIGASDGERMEVLERELVIA